MLKRGEGKKMRNLLILGAGGHGHVVAETARAMQDSEGIRFTIRSISSMI